MMRSWGQRTQPAGVLAWFGLLVTVACGGNPVKPRPVARQAVAAVAANAGSTAGGTVVTITGTNFSTGVTVNFLRPWLSTSWISFP